MRLHVLRSNLGLRFLQPSLSQRPFEISYFARPPARLTQKKDPALQLHSLLARFCRLGAETTWIG